MSEGNKNERPATRSTEAAAEAVAEQQQQLTLATLVTELQKSWSNITEALKTALLPIQTTLEAVKRQVDSFEVRFTEAEGALSDHSDRIITLETSIENLQSTIQNLAKEKKGLKHTLDAYENR